MHSGLLVASAPPGRHMQGSWGAGMSGVVQHAGAGGAVAVAWVGAVVGLAGVSVEGGSYKG